MKIAMRWQLVLVITLMVFGGWLGVPELMDMRSTRASAGAVLTVNTLADNATIDEVLTLREAINLTTGTFDLLSFTEGECAQISNSNFAGTCTTTDDLGPGARETIVFAPPGLFPSGPPPTISVTGSALPVNSDPVGVEMDGSGTGIIIDGSALGGNEDGLLFASGAGNDLQDVTVRSITIQNFPGDGLSVCGGEVNDCADAVSDTLIDDVTSNGNGGFGVRVGGQSNNSARVQDSTANGNAFDGINLSGFTNNNPTVTRSEAHGNAFDGLEVNGSSGGNFGATITDNVATDNNRGLQYNSGAAIEDGVVSGNTFAGNAGEGARIGTGSDDPMNGTMVTSNNFSSNGEHGLLVDSDAPSESPNVIAENEANGNNEDGLHISGGSGHTLSRNSTSGNGELGIDLRASGDAAPGVTLNDANDGDAGPNDLLNYPEVVTSNGQEISGAACGGCTIEVFRSDGDPSGHGEGETFLAEGQVNGGGSAGSGFTVSVCELAIGADEPLTMTATNPDGSTSEFSPNFTLGEPPGVCPSPTSTPTVAPTPSTGPVFIEVAWGDDDCDGDVDAVDALKNLQDLAAILYESSCPFGLGNTVDVVPAGAVERLWGDVDCDGDVDAVDALSILRSIAALPVNQEPGCPGIGSLVAVA